MLRGLLSVVVALIPLCLPLRGGGSDSSAPEPAGQEPSLLLPPPTQPARLASLSAQSASSAPSASSASSAPSAPSAPVAGEAFKGSLGPRREILFSFDDGPDLEGTPLVMEELDRRGLKGIFFVNGKHLVGSRPEDLARRDIVRKLVNHGHMVANHGFSHANLCRSPELLVQEVDGNAEIITHSTGIRPLLFRSPYGARCASLDRALHERDLTYLGWDMDPQDWRQYGQEDILRYVTVKLRKLNKRSILLLHDTHPSAVRALPRILDWIDAENRRLARQGGTPIAVGDYAHFLPRRPLPHTGLEPILSNLTGALSLLPGTSIAQARLGLR